MMNRNQDPRVNVLGLHFDNVTMTQMKENIMHFMSDKNRDNLFIVTANPEIANYATRSTFNINSLLIVQITWCQMVRAS